MRKHHGKFPAERRDATRVKHGKKFRTAEAAQRSREKMSRHLLLIARNAAYSPFCFDSRARSLVAYSWSDFFIFATASFNSRRAAAGVLPWAHTPGSSYNEAT